jgi:5'(3')-deoxyribonucleotidase
MTKPFLLLDVDGVLLDWLGGFEQYLLKQAPELHRDFSDLHDAQNLEQLLGMSTNQMEDWINQFHHAPEFEFLSPLPGAQAALRTLAPWVTMVCITASGRSPDSERMRKANLKEVFGDVFEEVWCTDGSVEKPKYLHKYPEGYWVEDTMNNAIMGVKAGHMSFLMDAIYNKHAHHDQVRRVSNMAEVGEIILSQLHSKFLQKAQS